MVVNDGSTDETAKVLDELAQKDNRIEIIHQTNSGHGPALTTALQRASSDKVFLIDSDRQIPLSCFPKMWELSQSAEAVLGTRQNRQDPPIRSLLSSFMSLAIRLLFGVKLIDANAPCKIIKRQIWLDMKAELKDSILLAPSLYLAIYAKTHHYKVTELAVVHRSREAGKSSLSATRLVKFGFNVLHQLLQFQKQLS